MILRGKHVIVWHWRRVAWFFLVQLVVATALWLSNWPIWLTTTLVAAYGWYADRMFKLYHFETRIWWE